MSEVMSDVMVQTEEKRPVVLEPGYDAPALVECRPFSRAVMVAVPVTLFSLLAVVSPLLWIAPIAALVFSLLAVRATSVGERPPLGRKVAIVCLTVSCFVLG